MPQGSSALVAPATDADDGAMVDATTLTLRPVALGDVDGLVALYGTLSAQDRYRRFFSAFVPPRSFFEHMATVVARGGFGVVAVEPGGRIVGEANYEPLADGDGELGMAVAPDARGIGHRLLDELIGAAQARGVPNIEADVLVTNGRMLSLLRGRGYATLTSGDWVSRRLVVGTAGPTPVWPAGGPGLPDPGRPRVLVEVPGGFWPNTEAAEAAGLAVITCSGPRGRPSRCPVLAGRPCPLVAGADAVVVAGAPDDEPCWPALLRGHAEIHPDVPVCVERRGGPRLDVPAVARAARPRAAARAGG
jgi:ribosomal protein S18 acetylase RimI-like enzyme